MIVRYGNFTHDAKEVSVQPSNEVLRTPRGEPWAIQQRITLAGARHGNTQSELVAAIQSLLNAYSTEGRDISLSFNDGTPTPDIHIANADTIGGIQVLRLPSHTPRFEGEYSTYWHYTIELSAKIRLGSQQSRLVWRFGEKMSFRGNGGEKRVWLDLKRQPAQRQIARDFTRCTATQTGSVVGLNGYLDGFVPRPRWPELLDNESQGIDYDSPIYQNGSFVEYGITWSYNFENNRPFPGSPYPNRL